MDVNGTRFELLLGLGDWGRCVVANGGAATTLAAIWELQAQAKLPVGAKPVPLEWDARRCELTLRRRQEKFVAAPADQPVSLSDRRGAAADRFGNIYYVDATQTRILVRSVGSARVSEFWPTADNLPRTEHGDFSDAAAAAPLSRRLTALAVTEDHYLVAACGDPAGLLVFDLLAGGPPLELRWPVLFQPIDMIARPGCGVLVLDASRRYWALDGRLGAVTVEPAVVALEAGDFQSVSGVLSPPRTSLPFPPGVRLDTSLPRPCRRPDRDRVARGGEVLVLDRGAGTAAAPPRVVCYRDGKPVGVDSAGVLIAQATNRTDSTFVPHDFVFVSKPGDGGIVGRLFVVTTEGNQAFAYDVRVVDEDFGLRPVADFYPLRRFEGKGLVAIPASASGAVASRCEPASDPAGSGVFYDFGGTWVPLIRQNRARYDEAAELVTPVLDGGEPECVWHRLMLDAHIPRGSRVEVWSVAADDKAEAAAAGDWMLEPDPYYRRAGTELPWAIEWPRPGCDTSAGDGDGTWELLFQHARGRYMRLKIVLAGDGRVTPRLRALRAWYPRYSYLERYLPALYREEPASASFFERFLANFEGYYTALEGRMASLQALFDVRSAPPDVLDWLADWFGVAIDPAWDERRRRLFIGHAMTFFQYRGTVHGLKMALHLAFDPRVKEEDLGPPSSDATRLADIRIIENYLLRRAPSVVFGEPEELDGPRLVAPGADWTPAEGNAGIVRRYFEHVKRPAPPGVEAIPFPLGPPQTASDAARWKFPRGTADEAAEIAEWHGFVLETLGVDATQMLDECQRWQDYLAAEQGVDNVKSIGLPGDEPGDPVRRQAWEAFVLLTAASPAALERKRWQDFLAQRYRRIEALNAQYKTHWTSFGWIALPDRLPADGVPLLDWLQFQQQVKPMFETAHTFRVLLPTVGVGMDPATARARIDLAQRIVDLEKPAHTVFDIRFFWAMFRIGDARLGLDTLLDQGSRAPGLISDAVVGQGFVGASFVAGAAHGNQSARQVLPC